METEEQQVEELKRWWQEHGRTVIAGVVLGLGSVIGFNGWRAHVDAQAEAVSIRYEALVNTAALPDHARAVEQADALIRDHPQTAYAGLAALVGAHAAYRAKDAATAQRLLQWAVDHGDALEVRSIARVRLARVLAEQGQHDAALAQLDQITEPEFAALAGEARGDVLAAKRDVAGARGAYEGVLSEDKLTTAARGRVQLKLDSLASSGG